MSRRVIPGKHSNQHPRHEFQYPTVLSGQKKNVPTTHAVMPSSLRASPSAFPQRMTCFPPGPVFPKSLLAFETILPLAFFLSCPLVNVVQPFLWRLDAGTRSPTFLPVPFHTWRKKNRTALHHSMWIRTTGEKASSMCPPCTEGTEVRRRLPVQNRREQDLVARLSKRPQIGVELSSKQREKEFGKTTDRCKTCGKKNLHLLLPTS